MWVGSRVCHLDLFIDSMQYHADGGGLYLQISSSGSRSWIFRFTLAKRSREMGLGPLSAISLAEARSEAARCRKLLLSGVDPIDDRKTRVRHT